MDKQKGKYIITMDLAVTSLGICLILSTFDFSLLDANPVPTWYLTSGYRTIHGLPVLRRAFSVVHPSGGEGLDVVRGKIQLEETSEGVFITGTIFGLKPGRHGFHVHQEGNLGENCKSSGGHYNPAGVSILSILIKNSRKIIK